MFSKRFQIIAIVERELLAATNIPPGNNPKFASQQFSIAIRRTAMVDESSGIPLHIAVQVVLGVQVEDAAVVPLAALEGLAFVDALSEVPDHSRPSGDSSRREAARSMNRRWAKRDEHESREPGLALESLTSGLWCSQIKFHGLCLSSRILYPRSLISMGIGSAGFIPQERSHGRGRSGFFRALWREWTVLRTKVRAP